MYGTNEEEADEHDVESVNAGNRATLFGLLVSVCGSMQQVRNTCWLISAFFFLNHMKGNHSKSKAVTYFGPCTQ